MKDPTQELDLSKIPDDLPLSKGQSASAAGRLAVRPTGSWDVEFEGDLAQPWWISVADTFVPQSIHDARYDQVGRARMMVMLSLAMFGVSAGYFSYLAIARPGSLDPLTAFLGLAALAYLSVPIILRKTGSLSRAGLVLVGIVTSVICFGAIQGGKLAGGWVPWAVTTPVIATFIVGPRLGFGTALVFAAVTTAAYLLDPASSPGEMAGSGLGLTMSSILLAMSIVTVFAWLFEVERTQAVDRLAQSERRFRRLADQSADAVLVHDANGRITDANARACGTLGYTLEELIAMPLSQIDTTMPGPERYQHLRSGRHISIESKYRREDGNTYPVDVRVSVFEAGGRPLYISSARDVTGRHYADQALRHAKEEAERANRAKSQLLANMSHELRTPLNSIIGFARVLERGKFGELEENNLKFVKNISEAGDHMLSMVNDLLEYRRVEEGRSTLDLSLVQISNVIDEVLVLVRSDVDDRQHIVQVDLPDDLPSIMTDRHATIRIVTNLVSNAARYTKPGGKIEIRASSGSKFVTISVADNGIGVAADDQSRIFEYFEQVQSKAVGPNKGYGLGLALTRQLVTNLGGNIGLESTEGVGSTFWFTLPLVIKAGGKPDEPTSE
ncbi:MAG: PAS domain S-box-containing protein [Myxococcota bacterium]|jgi:PAS domain S-box-containing protein